MTTSTEFFLKQRGIPMPTKEQLAETKEEPPAPYKKTARPTTKPKASEPQDERVVTKEEIVEESKQQYQSITPGRTYKIDNKPMPGILAQLIMGKQYRDISQYMSTHKAGQKFTVSPHFGIRPKWEDEQQAISWGTKNLRFDNPMTKERESMSYTELKKQEPALYLGYRRGVYSLSYNPERWASEQDKMLSKNPMFLPIRAFGAIYGFAAGQTERFYELVTGHEQTPSQFMREYRDPFGYNVERSRYLRASMQYDISKKVTKGDVLGVAGDVFSKTPVGLVGTYGMGYGMGAFSRTASGATKVFKVGRKSLTLSQVAGIGMGATFAVPTTATLVSSGFDRKAMTRLAISLPIYGSVFQSGYMHGATPKPQTIRTIRTITLNPKENIYYTVDINRRFASLTKTEKFGDYFLFKSKTKMLGSKDVKTIDTTGIISSQELTSYRVPSSDYILMGNKSLSTIINQKGGLFASESMTVSKLTGGPRGIPGKYGFTTIEQPYINVGITKGITSQNIKFIDISFGKTPPISGILEGASASFTKPTFSLPGGSSLFGTQSMMPPPIFPPMYQPVTISETETEYTSKYWKGIAPIPITKTAQLQIQRSLQAQVTGSLQQVTPIQKIATVSNQNLTSIQNQAQLTQQAQAQSLVQTQASITQQAQVTIAPPVPIPITPTKTVPPKIPIYIPEFHGYVPRHRKYGIKDYKTGYRFRMHKTPRISSFIPNYVKKILKGGR